MVNGIGGKNANNFIQKFLQKTSKQQESLFQQLSSGKRKLNGSELAVVADLEANVKTLGQASRNAGDASSALQIAEGSLEQIGDITTRLEELAIQSSNGVLSDDQRSALAAEFNSLKEEVGRIQATTEFNGKPLFGEEINAQVGIDGSANSGLSVGVDNIGGVVSSLASLDISTQGGAQSALASISDARDTVSQARGNIGANQKRLEVANEGLQQARLTNEEAASTIRDLDIADATARRLDNQIKLDIGTSLAASTNKLNASNILKLIS